MDSIYQIWTPNDHTNVKNTCTYKKYFNINNIIIYIQNSAYQKWNP